MNNNKQLNNASNPETTIVIRARNEGKWIEETLKRIAKQTYRDFEILVVDSGSTDKTRETALQYGARVIEIKAKKFTFPYATNIGISNAKGTKYIVMLSAHSLPISNNWLQNGIDKFSLAENIMGVYGSLLPLPDGSIWDYLFYTFGYVRQIIRSFPRRYRIIRNPDRGVLGFTNAIIRKDLWNRHHADESFAGGGDDAEWSKYWFNRKYIAVMDIGFTVRHSHSLSLAQWRKQREHWRENSDPRPFKYFEYRNDPAHKID